jgi:hypothetical protein
VLFADASRIDLRAVRREYAVQARLLGIGLPLTIALGWALGVAVVGGLGWAEVLVLAVILAPTDAALGQAVVTDRRLPSRIRQGLSVESGLPHEVHGAVDVQPALVRPGHGERDEQERHADAVVRGSRGRRPSRRPRPTSGRRPR